MGLECTWTDYRTEFCTSCTPLGGSDSIQEPVLSRHCKPRGVRTSVTSPRCARRFALHVLLYGFFHVCDTVIGRLGEPGWTFLYAAWDVMCRRGSVHAGLYMCVCVCVCVCVCSSVTLLNTEKEEEEKERKRHTKGGGEGRKRRKRKG